MAENTKIEWADATVNHWAGCTKVSPACDNCYAQRMAGRLWKVQWGAGQPRRQFVSAREMLEALDRKAQRIGKRLRVFHNSLSDMFDKEVPDGWSMDAFKAMADTPNLQHLVLTKRIGNVRPYTKRDGLAFDLIGDGRIWLGITVVNQEEADRDIPKLLAVPAAKRFLSIEPMLGPVNLNLPTRKWVNSRGDATCDHCCNGDRCDDPTHFSRGRPDFAPHCRCPYCRGTGKGTPLDWIIVGGESGPGARPMHPDWVRSLRDQCAEAGVPFLFKQWGNWRAAAWFDGPQADAGEEDDFVDLDRTEHVFLANDGREWDTMGGRYMYPPMPLGHWCLMVREPKERAGRVLDGRTYDEFPSEKAR